MPDANPLRPALRGIEHLAAYATTFRYPTSAGRILPSPTSREIEADIRRVEDVLVRAAGGFGVDLTRDDSPAQHATPLR